MTDIASPPQPSYVFTATCAIGSSLRSSLLRSLEESTTPLGWKRVSAQVFEKRLVVATADLASAEEEFLTTLQACLATEPVVGYVRVKFDSSSVIVQE